MSRSGSGPLAGWRRHVEGWQLLAIAGSIAVGAAALAIPRPVAPREMPLPAVDRVEQSRLERDEAARLAAAEKRPLPYLVRAAGEAFRTFGAAESGPVDATTREARQAEFSDGVAAARKRHGDQPLLDLRAVQTALFVRAVNELRLKPTPGREVLELGGAFVSRARETGWIDGEGRVLLDDGAAACVFRVRWTKLSGLLETRPFSPTVNEWRLYYWALLAHAGSGSTELAAYIDALVKHDSEYPAQLARGIVAYWDGRYGEATELFAQHLAHHPTGAWRLRAQNYLLAAYERAPRS